VKAHLVGLVGFGQGNKEVSLLVMVMELRDVDCGILLPTKSSLAEICTWNNQKLFRITKGDLFANSGNHCMA
jgi:hypothetical protein